MKIRALSGGVALALAASAASADTFAFTVEQFHQTVQNGGGPVAPARSNPNSALGPPQGVAAGTYFSPGMGGFIVLGFGGEFGSYVRVWEATQGNIGNHPETADVFVGWGGPAASATYQLIGSMSNLESPKTFDLAATNAITGRTTYSYVKIVDTSNGLLLPNTADGFDIEAVAVGPVPAPGSIGLLAAAGLTGSRRRRR